jgi:hypothetical protein
MKVKEAYLLTVPVAFLLEKGNILTTHFHSIKTLEPL